jgi:hypothetical protein
MLPLDSEPFVVRGQVLPFTVGPKRLDVHAQSLGERRHGQVRGASEGI